MQKPLEWIIVGKDPFHAELAEGTNQDGRPVNSVGKVYRKREAVGFYYHCQLYTPGDHPPDEAFADKAAAMAEVERLAAAGRTIVHSASGE